MILLPETGLDSAGRLIAPPGLAKGLRHEVLHPGKDCGFFRNVEGIDIIPQEEWQPFIDSGLTLRGNNPFLFNQGSVGSCAAEGINGGVEICRDAAGMEPVKFNPYAMYYTTSGGRDNGSSLIANLREARERGCVPDSVFPRSNGWRAKPTGAAYEAAKSYRLDEFFEISNWVEYGSALLQRFAVYSGYSGHAWVAVGLANTQQIIWRNSWGTSWGDQGYGVLNASRLMWNYGVYAVRTTTIA